MSNLGKLRSERSKLLKEGKQNLLKIAELLQDPIVMEYREINKISKKGKVTRLRIAELSQNSTVIEYIEAQKKDSELCSRYCEINGEILMKKQKKCPHYIWYELSTEQDVYEGRLYLKCKCLECEKIKEDSPEVFKRFIDESFKCEYETVKKDYEKIRRSNKGMEADDIFKILKAHYSK